MNFLRLLIVTVSVTVAGGVFGALVGGLVGYSVPSSFIGEVGVAQSPRELVPSPDQAPASGDKPAGAKYKVNAGLSSDGKNLWTQGAAIGGAAGLLLGSLAGMVIGMMDQLLHLLSHFFRRKREAAGTPPVQEM